MKLKVEQKQKALQLYMTFVIADAGQSNKLFCSKKYYIE